MFLSLLVWSFSYQLMSIILYFDIFFIICFFNFANSLIKGLIYYYNSLIFTINIFKLSNIIKMNHSVSTVTGKIKIKIVFLGNQAVGKSSVIERYINAKFDQNSHPTIGIDFLSKNIQHKNKIFRLQLWDTAGQQRFRSLIPGYLKDAHCALILFDVTNKISLNNADSWLSLYNQNKSGKGFTFLIGNKIDLDQEREVSLEQGKQKAKQLGVQYFQISAKTGQNIQQLFTSLLDVCVQQTLQAANFTINSKETKQKGETALKNRNQDQKNGKTNLRLKTLNNNKDQNRKQADAIVKKKSCC